MRQAILTIPKHTHRGSMIPQKCRYAPPQIKLDSTTKTTCSYTDVSLTSSFNTDKGKRPYQEDRQLLHSTKAGTIVGVLDGHAGAWVSQWLSEHFGPLLQLRMFEKVRNLNTVEKICKEIQNAFLQTDAYLYSIRKKHSADESGGSTVTGFMYLGSALPSVSKSLFIFNLGDSRTYVWKVDRVTKMLSFVFCTRDHVPSDSIERDRILRSGGWVLKRDPVHRVNGILAVSRAMGDFEFKRNGTQQYSGIWVPVAALPSVEVVELEQGEQYLILSASDGLFEYPNIEAYLQSIFQMNQDTSYLAESLVSRALTTSTDNVSANVTLLNVQ